MPPLPLGDDIESPGQRFLRFLRYYYPGRSIPHLAKIVGCTHKELAHISSGHSSGYDVVRKYARRFHLNPEDLNASPTSLDRILSDKDAFIRFLGIEPNQAFRLWAVKLLTMIRDERSIRWKEFVARKGLLADKAAHRRLVRRMSVFYRTSEANILLLIQHSPQWTKRFEALLKEEVEKIKRTGVRRQPKKHDKRYGKKKRLRAPVAPNR